ncbi:mRNA splicing factor [Handroanthus impetiginosus]|uniref:mRNA splicing factor n=1 Tax=Handroanthus impetiginosus TaxID=429701 RepID=A0A2G9GEU1_9LAMI|nr:mRNA splicing factor [Handroanthus impetiginosus]
MENGKLSSLLVCCTYLNLLKVIVRKWNQKEERFIKLPEEEEERFSDAVKRLEFDKQLGPYTLSQYGDWKRLSSYVTKDTIERIEPIGGEITIARESEMVGKFSKTAMEKALDDQLKNCKFSTPEEKSERRGCYYTAIPRVVKHKGMCGTELTNLNIDKTQLLESILMKEYGGDEDSLLAELQFAFIVFLMGQSLEAFLQWKLLVSLLFGCTEAPLRTRSQLFTKFIKVIYYQLKHGFQKDQKDFGAKSEGVSALLDESWLSSDSFLHHLCKDFFSFVLEAKVVDGDLLSWTRRLKELLEDSLGWQLGQNTEADGISFEDDEYAPVVEILDNTDCRNI